LGSLLFIVYINDIIKKVCLEGCSIKIFADGTLIYVTGESSAELERKMNMVFSIVEKWTNANKLKMNTEKTKYMIVRNVRIELRSNITLKCLDGTEVWMELKERVEIMKYLGIIIDDSCNFKTAI